MEISFLFATDLHGDRVRIERLIKEAEELGSPPIILGGDLFRAGKGNDIDSQEKLLQDIVEPGTRDYRGDILTIFGNNDWKNVADRIDELAPSLITLQGKDHTLDSGLKLKGLSFVPPSPFMIKDWERMEKYGDNEKRGTLSGLCSFDGGLKECSINGRKTMLDEIEKLGSLKGSILVSHGPPYGTCADMSRFSRHLGSMDLRKVIEVDRPMAILCGHIHESPDISGNPICRIGDCIVGNPGSRMGELTYLIGYNDGSLSLDFRSC